MTHLSGFVLQSVELRLSFEVEASHLYAQRKAQACSRSLAAAGNSGKYVRLPAEGIEPLLDLPRAPQLKCGGRARTGFRLLGIAHTRCMAPLKI